LLLSTVGYLGYLVVAGESLAGNWWHLAVGVAVVLSGTALGKILGQFYWNIVLARTARRLERLADASTQVLTGARKVLVDPSPTRPTHPGSMH